MALIGRFMLAPKFEIVGLLEDSSPFGSGEVSGKLKLPKDSLVPKLNLLATADRQVRAEGKLTEAVDPVLSVTPTSFDFGALHLAAEALHAFSVANVGAGVLLGEASLLTGTGGDFGIVDVASYGPLELGGATASISIRFTPTTPGAKTAQFLFDVGGGRVGAQVVTLTGEGGIAELTVDPVAITFDDTPVLGSAFETVTVTNTGDGQLTGDATLTGDDFALLEPGSIIPEDSLHYELDPGEDFAFSVRFRPTILGDKTGSLELTGGGGATVPLSGGTP